MTTSLTGRSGRSRGRIPVTCHSPAAPTADHTRPEAHRVKFRIDRDTLADAVAWTARSLPTRPSVPGPRRSAGRDRRRRDSPVGIRLRDLHPRHAARRGHRRRARAGLRSSARRDRASRLPAAPGRRLARRHQGPGRLRQPRFSLQTMPVEEYPQLPEMPTSSGTVKADDFATAVAQARRRRRSRRDAAAAHRRPPRARGLDDLADGHRPLPRQPARLCRGTPRPGHLGAGPGPGARRSPRPRSRSPLAATSRSRCPPARPATASSASRARSATAPAAPPPACSRATSRASASCSRRRPRRSPTSSTQAFVDSVKRVALVAERNTPVRLTFSDGQVLARGRQRRRGAGVGDRRGHDRRRRHLDRLQPDLPARGARGHVRAGRAPVLHAAHQARRDLAESQEIGADPDCAFRYLIMPVRLQN